MKMLGLAVLLLALFAGASGQSPVTTSASPQAAASTPEKPRVFITDSQSWETRGSAGGSKRNWGSYFSGGARPQTAEIIKTFGQRCPQVMVNNRQEIADYIVILDHEGGKGYLQHRNKVAVFERLSGDAVISHSTLSLGGSVQEACEGIKNHWMAHGAEIRVAAAKQVVPSATTTTTTPASGPVGPVSEPSPNGYGNPSPNVANIQPGSLQQPALIAAAPQEVIVDFRSTPTGADITVDGSMVGSTPSSISLSPGEHIITISKQDFRTYERTMTVKAGHPVVAAYLQQVKTTIQFDHPQ